MGMMLHRHLRELEKQSKVEEVKEVKAEDTKAEVTENETRKRGRSTKR